MSQSLESQVTPPDLKDGGFAFSDVPDLRAECSASQSNAPGWNRLHNLLPAKVHPSPACFTDRVEILRASGYFGGGGKTKDAHLGYDRRRRL